MTVIADKYRVGLFFDRCGAAWQPQMGSNSQCYRNIMVWCPRQRQFNIQSERLADWNPANGS
jgi:hypothetical protein